MAEMRIVPTSTAPQRASINDYATFNDHLYYQTNAGHAAARQ